MLGYNLQKYPKLTLIARLAFKVLHIYSYGLYYVPLPPLSPHSFICEFLQDLKM